LLSGACALSLFGPGSAPPWKWPVLGALLLVAGGGVAVGLTRPSSKAPFLATMVLAGLDIVLFAVSGQYLS
jgi:hypothetical protein